LTNGLKALLRFSVTALALAFGSGAPSLIKEVKMSVAVRVWLLLAAVVLMLPAPASARVVQCGEVVTVDTRVDNDLVCPTRVGLEIGADGVDLDLHGHTIQAVPFLDENGNSFEEGEALRIVGYDDASVANGTAIAPPVGYAFHAAQAERLSVRRLSTSGYGSLFVSGDSARIVDVTARGFGAGITSNGATIERFTAETSDGVDVFGQAMEVANSDFREAANFHVDGSSLHGNVFTDRGSISGNANSLLRNRGGQLLLHAGGGSTVRGNQLTNGLVLNPGFSGNLIEDNIVSGGAESSDFDGIHVAAGAADNVLMANMASGSADDGIDVEEPSTTLAGNHAFANGDLGIEAVAGVIDGGRNRAWNNGNPLQCLNVDCG
jgi:hypothetical protein